MAKNNTVTVNPEELTEKNNTVIQTEAPAPAAEEKKPKKEPVKKDPFEEKTEIHVPRKPKGEEQYYYICVNDRRFQVPANGKTQSLPKPVALILQDALDADDAADDYAASIPNNDPTAQRG